MVSEVFFFALIFIGQFFIDHHMGIKVTGTDRNRVNYRIGPDCAGRAQLQ